MLSIRTTLLAGALLALPVHAQNMLTNPGFETGDLTGWNAFGNAFVDPANPPQFEPFGNFSGTVFGPFAGPGTFGVTGIFQAFPATAGDQFTMDAWSRHWSGDPVIGSGPPNDNWCVMKMAFFDAGNAEIGAAEATIIDGNSPTDTWIDNAPITGTAPAGTVRVEAFILFLQPNNVGGAAQVDDIEFSMAGGGLPTYPGSGEDCALATGIAGAAPTGGAGNDVKTATAGDLIEINVSSPGGGFAQTPYLLLGQLFVTGAPPAPILGSVYLNPGLPVFTIVNGAAPTPLGPPLIGPNGGSSSFVQAPVGSAGISVILQGFPLSSAALNGAFATTDAHEIQFN